MTWWEVPLHQFHENSQVKEVDSKTEAEARELFFTDYYQPDKMTSFDAVLQQSFNVPLPEKSEQSSKYGNNHIDLFSLSSRQKGPHISVDSDSDSESTTAVRRAPEGTKLKPEKIWQISDKDLRFFREYVQLENLKVPITTGKYANSKISPFLY